MMKIVMKVVMLMATGAVAMTVLGGCGNSATETAAVSEEKYADSAVFAGNEKYNEIKNTLSVAYAGTTDTDKLVYYVINEEATRGILVMRENNADTDPHAIMMIGDITDNGDGTFTLLDVSSWAALTYTVDVTEEMGEEAYTISFNGMTDTAALFPANKDSVLEKISELN